MAKNKNDYFQLASTQVSYCVKAAEMLKAILESYGGQDLDAQRQHIHEIEHQADDVYHDILTRLYKEFITPIDQEDILQLVQIIDDVTDSLDQVMLDCYMYHVTEITPKARELAEVVTRCVKALDAAISEMPNFKRPEKLRKLLVAVNDIESEADEVYTEAVYDLFGNATDPRQYVGCMAVYDSLENCCDLCEHAADAIEQIIIKNT